jgi:DNA-binding beta-propeller fold protein YncE
MSAARQRRSKSAESCPPGAGFRPGVVCDQSRKLCAKLRVVPSSTGGGPERGGGDRGRRRPGRRRFLAPSLLAAALLIAGCGSSGQAHSAPGRPDAGHALDARLSLTGSCAVSAVDRVPDPGCPYRSGHRPRPFDNPCGVATDRQGYIYVANSGRSGAREGRIDVFDPRGRFVTEIALPRKISERPCRIAVDPRGRIYIAARPLAVPSQGRIDTPTRLHATAFRYAVLRYTPDSYPPRAGTEYGLPIIFAAGGEDYGVAVNPIDDRVYVASGINRGYGPEGRVLHAASEVQRVAVDADGGAFTLTFAGNTTMPIPYGASPARVRRALEATVYLKRGDVAVRGRPGARSRYLVTFGGEFRDVGVERISCDASGLSGGARRCTVSVVTRGNDGALGYVGRDIAVWGRTGRVFASARDIRRGRWVVNVYDSRDRRLIETIGVGAEPARGYPAVAVDQANGDVYLDFESRRIDRFARDGEAGSYERVGSIRYIGRRQSPSVESDLAVDGAAESPNRGYLFVTSQTGTGSRLYAFAPQGRSRTR